MDFCVELLKAERKVNQQEGEEEFKCYMIWQMVMALLHSNGQLKTERYGDREKGCQKPAVQQKTTDVDGCNQTCCFSSLQHFLAGIKIQQCDYCFLFII